MENFAPAILSKAASDIPADRLQWLHIINFFLSLTPSVPGLREGAGAAHTHLLGILSLGMTELHWKFQLQPLISSEGACLCLCPSFCT